MNKELKANIFFPSLIYFIEKPEWIKDINKISDEYIKKAKHRDKDLLHKRKERYGDIGDHGMTYHSSCMIQDNRLTEFKNFISKTSIEILTSQGYNLDKHKMFWTELWVQEFGKNGGGHHDSHIHGNNHMSGFYFLQCSNKTSYPVFHDPRPGALMTKLPLKKSNEIELGTESISFNIKPGTFIFFPGYLTHEFPFDLGLDTFRFIHFNVQAVHNEIAK